MASPEEIKAILTEYINAPGVNPGNRTLPQWYAAAESALKNAVANGTPLASAKALLFSGGPEGLAAATTARQGLYLDERGNLLNLTNPAGDSRLTSRTVPESGGTTAPPPGAGGTGGKTAPTGLVGRLMQAFPYLSEDDAKNLILNEGQAAAIKMIADEASGKLGGGSGAASRILFPEEADLIRAQAEAARAGIGNDAERTRADLERTRIAGDAEKRAALDSEVTRKVSLENLAINLRKMGLDEQAAIVDQRVKETQLSIQNMQADIAAAGELRASRQGKAEAALGLGRLSLDTQRAQNEQALQMYNLDTQRQAQERDILAKPSDVLARLFFQRGGTSPAPFVSQADLINRLRGSQPKLSPIQMDEGLRSRLTAILDAPDPTFERKPVMLTPTAPAPAAPARPAVDTTPGYTTTPSGGVNLSASEIAAGAKWQPTPGFAAGTEGTKARKFIVGDPQMPGEPNPERVTVHNPGKDTTVEVVPVGGVQQMRAKMVQAGLPHFAAGTDVEALYQMFRNGGASEQTASDMINAMLRSDRALATNEVAKASAVPQQYQPASVDQGWAAPTYSAPSAAYEAPGPVANTSYNEEAAPAVAGWGAPSEARYLSTGDEAPAAEGWGTPTAWAQRKERFDADYTALKSGEIDGNEFEKRNSDLSEDQFLQFTRLYGIPTAGAAALAGGAGSPALMRWIAGGAKRSPAPTPTFSMPAVPLSEHPGYGGGPQRTWNSFKVPPIDLKYEPGYAYGTGSRLSARLPQFALGTGVADGGAGSGAAGFGPDDVSMGRLSGADYDWYDPQTGSAGYGAFNPGTPSETVNTPSVGGGYLSSPTVGAPMPASTSQTPGLPQVNQDDLIRLAREATTPAGAAFLSGERMPELNMRNLPLPSMQQLGMMTRDERTALEPRLAAEYNTTLAELIDMMQKRYGGTRQRATARLGVR